MSASDSRLATILVVEDSNAIADLFRHWLVAEGYTVIVADTGAAALEAVRAHEPDIILLDIMIPPPGGFDVLTRLKQNPATRQIPVVLVSGLPELPNWRRGRELGAVEFLAKPFERDRLTACVRKHLRPSQAR